MLKKLFFSAIVMGFAHFAIAQSVSINPNNGNRGQSLPVVISGQNTSFTGQGSLILKQGTYVMGQGSQTAFTNVSVIDPTTIMAQLSIPSNAPMGFYDLYVTSGTLTSKTGAFVVGPSANSNMVLSPNGSKPGQTTNVTITVPGGSFKTQASVIEKVWLNKGTEILSDVKNITVVNSTTFTADIVIPANASLGVYDANIYTDDQIMYTTAGAFTLSQTFSTPDLDVKGFRAYPNPVRNFMALEFENVQLSGVEIQVISLTGALIQLDAGKIQQNGAATLSLDLADLKSGVYMIQVRVNSEVLGTRKFIKQ